MPGATLAAETLQVDFVYNAVLAAWSCMAINRYTFDSDVGRGNFGDTSWAHTVTTSNSRTCVLIEVFSAIALPATITLGGVTATLLVSVNGPYGYMNSAIYYVFNPPAGVQIVNVTLGSAQGVVGNSITYQNVGSVVSGGSMTSYSSQVSVAVNSAPSEIVNVFIYADGYLQGPTQRQRWINQNYNSAIQDAPGASAVTLDYTYTGAWSGVAARLLP